MKLGLSIERSADDHVRVDTQPSQAGWVRIKLRHSASRAAGLLADVTVRTPFPLPAGRRWISLLLLLLVGLAPVRSLAAAGWPPVVISEFMASNAEGLRDADGDRSDWIELTNLGAAPVNLAGWRLTDRLAQAGWTFPATNLPPGGFLVVFASGKDRAAAGAELHTDFRLAVVGEALALLAPDGSVASAFTPQFPPQTADVAYGVAREVAATRLVSPDSPARVWVPTDGTLENHWTGADVTFDDSGWLQGRNGVGYDTAVAPAAEWPAGFWNFNQSADAPRVTDASGHGLDGQIVGANYTSDRTGRSGQAGDRAMSFTPARNSRVEVPGFAADPLDAATQRDALTVSLWLYGGAAQPSPSSAFWFAQNADASGARAAQAHLPWSDRNLYWDTANSDDCCSPAARLFVAEPDSTRWRGAWNHYVLVKRGATKEIWQNGTLIHQAVGAGPLTTLRHLTIGSAPGGVAAYAGFIDDFAVWDRALSAGEIRGLAQGATPLNPLGLAPLLGGEVRSAMAGKNASVFVRLPFTVGAEPDFDSLQLRVQSDAGFVAYLNGVEVARRNAPDAVRWDSAATATRSREATLTFEELDLSGAASLLRVGQNALAFHGLNEHADSGEFFLRAELRGLRLTPDRFLVTPTPGAPNTGGVLGLLAAPTFSRRHDLVDAPFELQITSPTPGARLIYTLNGSAPSPTNGFSVNPPGADVPVSVTLTIRSNAFVRAAAFRAGFEPSPAVTQTYLFLDEVAHQPVRPPGLPAFWPDGAPTDFEVDPTIVNTTQPGYGFADALRSLPIVSLVAAPADFFDAAKGIYANAELKGDAWERAGSVEWLDPAGGPGFQVNCGLEIHGGISRRNNFTAKHSFALLFRDRYGPRELEFPVFPGSPVARFDELILKGLSTDTWPVVDPGGDDPPWHPAKASYLRDQWIRDTHLDMGRLAARGTYVHLFLNGLYWGLYDLTEHCDAAFQSDHLGGAKSEYDVLKDVAELDAGDLVAWNDMLNLAKAGLQTEEAYQRLQGNRPDGTRDPALPRLLDVPALIDYMILHLYIGATDWPNHNWWAGRRRGPESEGFRFFPWDQDISLNSLTRTTTFTGHAFAEVNVDNSPALPYAQLRTNANFRMLFADHVHRHFFNGGVLTPAANIARWRERAQQIDVALVAESARWGDARRATPFRREVEWLANERWMTNQFWPKNHPIALQRFRNAGLYPAVTAPTFSQHGGEVPAGFELTVIAATGRIYYTTDGADPRTPTGTVAPSALAFTVGGGGNLRLRLDASQRVRARVRVGTVWSALNEADFRVRQPLLISRAQRTAAGLEITFQAEAGVAYVVERRAGLGAGGWQPAARPPIQTADGLVTLTLPVSGESTGFFRVTAP